jgi:hypothetical protein
MMLVELVKVRAINDATWKAAMGRGGYVFCSVNGEKRRVIRARTVRGQVQVRVLSGGEQQWVVPDWVWWE